MRTKILCIDCPLRVLKLSAARKPWLRHQLPPLLALQGSAPGSPHRAIRGPLKWTLKIIRNKQRRKLVLQNACLQCIGCSAGAVTHVLALQQMRSKAAKSKVPHRH